MITFKCTNIRICFILGPYKLKGKYFLLIISLRNNVYVVIFTSSIYLRISMRGKTVKFPTRENTNFIPWILVSVKWCTLFGHKQGLLYSNDEKISIILIAGTIIENYVIIILCDLIYIVDRASVVSIGFLSHRLKTRML